MKEVVIHDPVGVAEFARLIDVRPIKVIEAAFEDLGRLATLEEDLTLAEAIIIGKRFGYRVRRYG